MMNNMVKKVADDLIKIIKNYRSVEQKSDSLSLNDNKQILEVVQSILNEAKYNKNDITLSATAFWNEILRAKIEVIGAMGGLQLMRQVYDELENNPENDEYSFSDRFSSAANGCCGWLA